MSTLGILISAFGMTFSTLRFLFGDFEFILSASMLFAASLIVSIALAHGRWWAWVIAQIGFSLLALSSLLLSAHQLIHSDRLQTMNTPYFEPPSLAAAIPPLAMIASCLISALFVVWYFRRTRVKRYCSA
jgi:hypothetical protein